MNILFLGSWSIGDPLTVATIYPNLRILDGMDVVAKIIFITIERKSVFPQFELQVKNAKVVHVPITPARLGLKILDSIADFISARGAVVEIAKASKIDLVIARGAPAGAIAYLSWRKNKIPFLVESFEPHADYMRESGIWTAIDPRYLFQKRWEKKQIKYATGLMPVANNYKQVLIQDGVPSEKVFTVPCSVDFKLFNLPDADKGTLRLEYDIPSNAVVGIYAGRFGGLYLEDEAFAIYKAAFSSIENFFLIILTPAERHEWVGHRLAEQAIGRDRFIIRAVRHEEVSKYIQMSDFAFATYKPGRAKAFLSPVKLGEYWACGVPVIMTEGVGDESEIMQNTGGVLFTLNDINSNNLTPVFQKMKKLLATPELDKTLRALALTLRNQDFTRSAYKYFLQSSGE
ncbi:MAG TPA: glycosyltransferase [Chryseosolibacter sp.]